MEAISPDIVGVISVGEGRSRAMAARVADPDAYDGISFGQVDLRTCDQYHASIRGYHLEALVVFGRITGIDPRTIGRDERAADDLGIAPATALALESIAQAQLAPARSADHPCVTRDRR